MQADPENTCAVFFLNIIPVYLRSELISISRHTKLMKIKMCNKDIINAYIYNVTYSNEKKELFECHDRENFHHTYFYLTSNIERKLITLSYFLFLYGKNAILLYVQNRSVWQKKLYQDKLLDVKNISINNT